MRAPHFLLLIGCSVTLLGCAAPRISTIHYSPPSVAPVRDRISSAQGHAAKAKAALLRVAQAASLLDSAAAPNLLPNLNVAAKEIDALTRELLNTQTALKDYELKVADQTEVANRAIDDKNSAITDADKTRRRYHTVKFYLCTVAAAGAALLAFQFRWLLALLGPWGTIAGLAGLPALTFGALWMWL